MLMLLASIVVVVAAVVAINPGDIFWNGVRSIPLGTLWRRPGFTLDELGDLSGQTVFITGANAGIGHAVAVQCARANAATVVLACRDEAKAESARVSVAKSAGVPVSRLRIIALDLDDLCAVDAATDALLATLDTLHVLVANAGCATQFPRRLTIDGIESTFQANFLGHFLLTTRLLPLLESTASRPGGSPSRIVHLTSGAHRGAPDAGVPLTTRGVNDPRIGPYARYGMAKLANLAFSNELARRRPAKLLRSNAVHPGVVATSMLRLENFVGMLGPLAGRIAWAALQIRNVFFAYSPDKAALSVLHCCTAGGTFNGELIVPVATIWPPRHPKANDPEFGRALWEFSRGLVQQTLDQRAAAQQREY